MARLNLEGLTYYTTKLKQFIEDKIVNKVDKVSGKGLSTNDLTNALKSSYDTAYTHSQATHARTDATKTESSSINGNLKINGTETVVYTHPSGTNPHGTTKNDVGLGNVDNTSDINKPVSTAQQNAINNAISAEVTARNTAIDGAVIRANEYTDEVVSELINGAPTTLDTLGEIASAMSQNESVIDALNEAIGSKANQSDLSTHIGNNNIHITETERSSWNAKSNFSGSYNDLSNLPTIPAPVAVKGSAETVYRTGDVNITPANLGITVVNNTADNNKSVKYASSAGTAQSAAELVDSSGNLRDTGNSTRPVFINGGVPEACDYTLEKSVPSDAVFTDTVYTHPNSGVAAGTYRSVTVNVQGHVTNGSNPTVTVEQGGTGATDAATARANLGITPDNIGASSSNHAHKYAGSASEGGSAYSAIELVDVGGSLKDVGSSTKPVYFNGGIPEECGYSLNADVPSNAKFTDTVYTHPDSGITAGTYRSVTVNAQGHVTGGSNPTATVAQGGTGATTAEAARTNLGITPANIGAATSNHTHNYAGSPSASGSAYSAFELHDVAGNMIDAGSSTKPVYFSGGIPDACSREIPSITNNLLATSSGTALDATQGKALNDKITSIDNMMGIETKVIDGIPNWRERGADTWSPFNSGSSSVTFNMLGHSSCNDGNDQPYGYGYIYFPRDIISSIKMEIIKYTGYVEGYYQIGIAGCVGETSTTYRLATKSISSNSGVGNIIEATEEQISALASTYDNILIEWVLSDDDYAANLYGESTVTINFK